MSSFTEVKKKGKKKSTTSRMVLNKKERNTCYFLFLLADISENMPLIPLECFLEVEFLVRTNTETFRLFIYCLLSLLPILNLYFGQ